jgi:serine/threonine protein kinase/tetratricopeptide (TPR) repeat protein
MQIDQRGRVRLGSFELNLQTGELRSLDSELEFRKVFLPEKPFRVLRMLIELDGELGGREEIRKRLWPNDTIVDFEHSINVAIATLRRAFGDSATEPKYIETVPRRGYRLVVPTEWLTAVDRESEFRSEDPLPADEPAPRAVSANMIGKKVSHFRVLEVIGGGGMGMVYRAEDLKLGRQVALKFLPEEMAADAVSLRRFEREAQTASSLNHPNICTIHEIEEYEGQPIIVMELLAGETLRDRLAASGQEKLPLDELLRIAIQTCNGLQAAHDKGIIHRDIKPANIFLTREGPAKILDFGLAKLVEIDEPVEKQSEDGSQSNDSRIDSRASVATDTNLSRTGLAMGTASYMSPEQVRKEMLDARTDLFSFGLVLYEMVSSQRAFASDNVTGVHEALLNQVPTPLRQLNPAVPAALEAVIAKALQKERANRYQTAAAMRADLELVPSPRRLRIRRIRKWLAISALILLVAAAAFSYWRYRNRFQLSASDTIVIADISNQTSDPVLDDALNFALPVELSQTPFLQVLAQDKVRETMSQLHHPLDGKVTPEIAREVCLKTNSKAVVTSAIADAGNHFRIVLTGFNCSTSQVFARSEQDSPLRNGVVHALGLAGAQLRSRMGEPDDSLRKFNKPLDLATSWSPEALQLLSQGFKKQISMDTMATIPLYERAIDIDPSFALAYATVGISYLSAGKLAQSVDAEKKAYELRDRLTGQLKFLAETLYYDVGLGDLQKSYPIYEEWIQTFPLDGVAHHNFSACLLTLGEYDKAASEAREAVRLMPLLRDGSYRTLMEATIFADRLEEAKIIFDETKSRKLDDIGMHQLRNLIAFLQLDNSGMQEQLAWLSDHDQMTSVVWDESDVHGYSGQFTEARRILRRFKKSGPNDYAWRSFPRASIQLALQEAEAGNIAGAMQLVNDVPKLFDDRDEKIELAMVFARTGNTALSKKLAEEISGEAPQNTIVQSYLLPTIRAAIDLRENKPTSAIELLRPTERYELAYPRSFNSVYPAYIRGLAYLQIGQGKQAAGEFQKLIDHPALVGRWDTRALSYLQLGRARVMMGDRVGAMKSYQDFLTIWKDADANLPTLIQAKAEYAALR